MFAQRRGSPHGIGAHLPISLRMTAPADFTLPGNPGSESSLTLRVLKLGLAGLSAISAHALGLATMAACILGTRKLAAHGGALVSCTYSVGPFDVFGPCLFGWIGTELLAQGAIAGGAASRVMWPVRFATRFTLGACFVVLFGGLIVAGILRGVGWIGP
jgi:hypothetical protein